MDLFPFINRIDNYSDTLPIFKDVGWDWLEDLPLIENGDFKIVTGDEAIKVWIYKAVKTSRYKYIVYNDDYGTEIYKLIGKGFTKGYTESEVIRFIKEAILINEYIIDINKISASFEGSKLILSANIKTIYSDELEVNFVV